MKSSVIRALLLALSAIASTAHAQTPKPLELEVFRAGARSLYANFTLIEGEHDAVLVDAPFTRADAHRVVGMILDSGRDLKYVYVTHDHPDHFFAMEVIQDAFPQAKIVSHPVVVADIWRSLPYKVKRWSPMLGTNAPVHPSAPQPLDSDHIVLEGRELQILGPMQGDHVHATAVWIPSIRALVAGDLVFNKMHLWLGEHTAAGIAAWQGSLQKLAALNPQTVVAGHAKPGLPNDASGIEFTTHYIQEWQRLAAHAKSSADLRKQIKQEFPDTEDVLDDFLLGNSSKVTMGEEPLWTE